MVGMEASLPNLRLRRRGHLMVLWKLRNAVVVCRVGYVTLGLRLRTRILMRSWTLGLLLMGSEVGRMTVSAVVGKYRRVCGGNHDLHCHLVR